MPPSPDDPIVLVENERTLDSTYENWQDITGEQYHYPNTYKGRVREGRRFIYYRGVRRSGGIRGTAEYFGAGRIGGVWPDPANDERPRARWQWFCSIEDYQPFLAAVPSRNGSNYYERVTNARDWGIGVRLIPEATYQRILAAAGVPAAPAAPAPRLPPLTSVVPAESGNLLATVPRRKRIAGAGGDGVPRRSRAAREYGRRAEEIVLRYLEGKRPRLERLRWVSDEREQPGWDIEYYKGPAEIAIEVKGTSGERFPAVELTANEWRAAERLRDRFWLYLVANCASASPQIQAIQDPWSLLECGQAEIETVIWRLRLLA